MEAICYDDNNPKSEKLQFETGMNGQSSNISPSTPGWEGSGPCVCILEPQQHLLHWVVKMRHHALQVLSKW